VARTPSLPIPCKLASIDIGSNAIRLMLAEYTPLGLSPIRKFRVPIRLGGDVFTKGKISAKNLKASARAFRRFAQILKAHKIQPQMVKAVGTSALREAANGEAFIELVRRKSGIAVEVIDGVEEAKLIHLGVKREVHLENHSCLLIDVGGGSVELTFSDRGLLSATHSFPFGTVRTLEKMRKRKLTEKHIQVLVGEYSQPMNAFLDSHKISGSIDFMVGTGGNIEALGRLKPLLLGKNSRSFLTLQEMEILLAKLVKIPFEERVGRLKLKPDRADVIIPAGSVVLNAMKLARVSRILIPYVGLKDGILWSILK
jgi:exopolyphosphatase/guanosine-5'-triphosphate,3'-diphosphate pyrophosphatase